MSKENLIPKHGGYKKLKSFQLAELIYDLTVRFCDLYIDRKSRTQDQMVQAARSGRQNIAEGSQASGTSKKFELKLTSVARASLEELKLDYEDFLRQKNYKQLGPNDPILQRFKEKRCNTVKDVRAWVEDERNRAMQKQEQEEHGQEHGHTDGHGRTRTNTDSEDSEAIPPLASSPTEGEAPTAKNHSSGPPLPSSALAANAILSLLNLCCYLLERQLSTQSKNFEEEGGFSERLYNTRKRRRDYHA